MTTITTPSISTFGTSFRASQSHNAAAANTFSYSDSPLVQLPQVDFNFQDLRKRMSDFTARFDAFIEQGRKKVLEERNEFKAKLGELSEEQRSTQTQINTVQSTVSSHSYILSREVQEKKEMQAQIANLEQHAALQRNQRDRLSQSIISTQRQIDTKVTAQKEYAERIEQQSRLNGPELQFWETYLCCKIEGGGDESIIRVMYTFPPMKNSPHGAEQQALFELHVPDVGSEEYKIVHTQPALNRNGVEEVVTKLNSTRDIGVLLKGMRALFAEEFGERMIIR